MDELYRKLSEFTADGVHCYTVDEGRILAANRGLVRILDMDCPPEAIIGKTLDEALIYVEKPGTIRGALEETGEIHDFEYHFKTLKGEDRWVLHESFLATDPSSGKKIVQAIIRDITPLKRAEQELAAEKERLRVTFQSIGDAVIATDMAGRVLLMNAVAEQLTGWKQEDAIGKLLDKFLCILDGRTGVRLENPVERVLQTGEVISLPSQATLVAQDNTHISIADNVAPIRNRDGQVIGAVLVFRDVTAQRRTEEQLRLHRSHLESLVTQRTSELAHSNAALQTQINEYARVEKALRESEERFRLAVTSAPLAVFRHDRQLRYTWFHYPRASFPTRDFIGKTDADLFPADEAARLTQLKRGVLETGIGARSGLPITYQGTTYFFDLTVEPLRDAQNKIAGLTCVALDVTERRHAEEDAHREAELLQLTHDAIFVCDMEGRIQFWNRGAEETYGWQQEEVLGRVVHQILGTHHPKPLEQITTELLETSRWEGELEQLTRDGQHVMVASRWALVRDEKGRPTGTLRIHNDITERKRMEENLRLSNVELEQFAYVASHDLQEPLRVISGFLQLLQHRYEGKLDAEADEYIRYAVDGAGRMRKLIQDLLEYSRVGRRGRPFAATDCDAIVKTVISNLQPALAEKQGHITCSPLPSVMGDPTELTQLFQNLISNAIKFHRPQPPEVHVAAELQVNQWQFHVRDNGIGIDPKNFERVFVIFQRLHSLEEYPGTGIGLALCKKIVERHGGRIWVESTPGTGSTFHFTIPAIGDASP